jgi:hypothetical protein
LSIGASFDYNDANGEYDGNCETIGKRLAPRPNPVLIHVFYPFGDLVVDIRKKQLMMLSFLATQCPLKSKLMVWYKNGEKPQLPLMPQHLRQRIELRCFGRGDIEKMGFSSNTTTRLIREWEGTESKAGATDVARITILYNYGGIWTDSDVLLLRDLSPISGLSFAYQAQGTFFNNALLGAASPRSTFVHAMVKYIDRHIQEHPDDGNYYKWGASMFGVLVAEGGELPLLPGCLLDGGWFGGRPPPEPAPVYWDNFFSGKAESRHVDYIDPRIARTHGSLAYHWHGRWANAIEAGSLADCADRLYRKALGIPFENSTLDDPQVLCNTTRPWIGSFWGLSDEV